MDKRSEIITAEQKQKQNSRESLSLLNWQDIIYKLFL